MEDLITLVMLLAASVGMTSKEEIDGRERLSMLIETATIVAGGEAMGVLKLYQIFRRKD